MMFALLLLATLLSASALGDTSETETVIADVRCVAEYDVEVYNQIPEFERIPIEMLSEGFYSIDRESIDFMDQKCAETFPETPYADVWRNGEYGIFFINFQKFKVKK